MRIEVAWSPAPRSVELLSLQLPVGSTVRDALQASGLAARVPESPAGAVPMRRPGASPDATQGSKKGEQGSAAVGSASRDTSSYSDTGSSSSSDTGSSSSSDTGSSSSSNTNTNTFRLSSDASAQASGAKPGAKAHSGERHTWRGLSLAVFGRKLTLDSELFDGDRLDCCRPLRVDPKLARRERFNQQGSRRSGLFAKRREGSVAGY